mgnify:FL=1
MTTAARPKPGDRVTNGIQFGTVVECKGPDRTRHTHTPVMFDGDRQVLQHVPDDMLTVVPPERKKLTAVEARNILREYPDADLSAFDVEGDVEAMAVEEAGKSLEAIGRKMAKKTVRR